MKHANQDKEKAKEKGKQEGAQDYGRNYLEDILPHHLRNMKYEIVQEKRETVNLYGSYTKTSRK